MKAKLHLWKNAMAVLMATLTLTLGVLSLLRAVGTVGKPFAGFFYGPNLLVSITQRAAWPGVKAGLKSLDQIVAVDGLPLNDGYELARKISHAQPGDTLTYSIERNGMDPGHHDVAVQVAKYSLNDFLVAFLAPFLMGFLFLFFGCMFYVFRPSSRGSLVYLTLSCFIAGFCMTLYEAYTTFTLFRVTLLYPMIGATSVHLFSIFPTSRISRPRVRFMVLGLYLFALYLVVWRQIALMDSAESVFLSRLSSLYVVLVLMSDVVLLLRAFQLAPNQMSKDRIRVIGIGLVIASSVVALWSLNFLFISQSFYLDEGVLLASVFPLFMAYAILRKNVFDLDEVLRLSLSYGVAGATVFSLYLAVIGGMREWLEVEPVKRFGGWIFLPLAVAGGILFNLIRLRTNRWVHALLYKGGYDVSVVLSKLDHLLESKTARSEIVEAVGQRVVDLLHLQKAAIYCPPLGPSDSPLVRWFGEADAQKAALDRLAVMFETEGFWNATAKEAKPLLVEEWEEQHPEETQQSVAALKALEFEAFAPFVAAGKLKGMLFLGRKRTKDAYQRIDFRLLRALAGRVATLLENADLTLRVEQHARLAALGEMSTVIIHDIKNPLSTIRTAAGSLKKRMHKEALSVELATIIEEEVDRMNHTIAEILTYAKPSGLALNPTDMNSFVREIANRNRPTFENAKIELSVTECDGQPKLTVDTSLMTRAIENLLVNAREICREGNKVQLKTSVGANGNGENHFSIVIEDDGPGMDAIVREKIFQPFYTTKPNGSGLGLALVKQIVSQHQGEVSLTTRPGEGTKFTLSFPMN